MSVLSFTTSIRVIAKLDLKKAKIVRRGFEREIIVAETKCSEYFFFFFYLDFLSRTFTIHGTAGERGGYLFNSSLPLPPASSAHSWQPDSNQEPLVSERKSLTIDLTLDLPSYPHALLSLILFLSPQLFPLVLNYPF